MTPKNGEQQSFGNEYGCTKRRGKYMASLDLSSFLTRVFPMRSDTRDVPDSGLGDSHYPRTFEW